MNSITIVAGARPNFMKIAPLMWELRRRSDLRIHLVHTGQHYDEKMSRLFFEELGIPRPDVDLQVGSATHAVQTAEVMKRFEPVLLEQRPDAVVVVGDVNSTLACALTAVKAGIPVAHVEAGLRSFDRSMPEEINRLLTDTISQWLFVSERSGLRNLQAEGIAQERVHFVGNVMIDTLLACRERCESSPILETVGLASRGYGVLTLHRPSNVDEPSTLGRLLQAIERLQREVSIVFPVHPRTRKALLAQLPAMPNLLLSEPLGYLDFLKLMSHASMVLTDSGGIQEETTVLGVPCLTLRNTTERPATVEEGTNTLVGLDPERIIAAGLGVLGKSPGKRRIPELWDGKAAMRIIDILTGNRNESQAPATGSPARAVQSPAPGSVDESGSPRKGESP
jgi:UDP-N-acetylglucosamine 2-epimerase (non-hydrolysing)